NGVWSRNLGPFISQHGAGASPILYQDLLIFCNDMDQLDEKKQPVTKPSTLFALNKKTGAPVWQAPRPPERACYSAPFLLDRPGQMEPDLVLLSTHAITGYNPRTGSKNWEASEWQANLARMPLRTVAAAAVAGDMLIACSGDGAGDRLAVAVALPGPG